MRVLLSCSSLFPVVVELLVEISKSKKTSKFEILSLFRYDIHLVLKHVVDFEASLLRLIEKMTNGSRIEIDETGSTLYYKPGILTGGKVLLIPLILAIECII